MKKKNILILLTLICITALSVVGYKIYGYFYLPNTNFNNEFEIIYLKTGSTYQDVKQKLQPLLKNMQAFEIVAQQKKYLNNVKAGKYKINKGDSNNKIISNLRFNNLPVRVSFNNQDRIENLSGRIAQQLEKDSLAFLTAFSDQNFLQEHNLNADTALSLFIPNTYEVYWNITAEDFRKKMVKEYQKFWNSERTRKADSLGLTPTQISILAAVVHKESVKIQEQPTIAGVYLNRLRENWLLQADPTVIYAVKKEKNNFDMVIKRVLYSHTAIDSPYNTYKYEGLPIGMIAMPDISAIDAVLNPHKHNYWFFCADVERFGYHKFASTLAEHNKNRDEYINWVSKQNYQQVEIPNVVENTPSTEVNEKNTQVTPPSPQENNINMPAEDILSQENMPATPVEISNPSDNIPTPQQQENKQP